MNAFSIKYNSLGLILSNAKKSKPLLNRAGGLLIFDAD